MEVKVIEFHRIYIVAETTSVDADHAVRAGGLTICTQRIMTTHLC